MSENQQLELVMTNEPTVPQSPRTRVDEFQHPWFRELSPVIVEKFREFHLQHENVLELFATYAKQTKQVGRSSFGIKAIAERVRWHVNIETIGTEGEEFKINNNFTSCYARLLMLRYPELNGMFELRSTPGTV